MTIAELLALSSKKKLKNHVYYMAATFVAADAIAVMLCFGLGFFTVNAYDLAIINFKSFVSYWPYLPAFILVFFGIHLYPGVALAPAEELRRFAIASFFGHMGIILSLYLDERVITPYSVAFAISWLVSVPGLIAVRTFTRGLLSKTEWWGIPVVIFGAGKTGKMIVDRLHKHRSIGYKPIALLDDDPALRGEYAGVPIIHGVDRGPELAKGLKISTAIVAMPGVDRHRLYEIMGACVSAYRYHVLIPDFFGMTNLWMSVRDLDGVLGLSTSQKLLVPANRVFKRLLDILLCLVGGALISPFLLLAALLIKLESPGPVFFGHKRLGRYGKPFKSWKFRSMVRDSAKVLQDLIDKDPAAKAEWEANFKLRKDPRITKIGAFLRKTSLDELPQLWNVLKGEMSLIGPRPIIQDEVAKYGQYYGVFSSVLPGLSGLWQVSGRSELDYDERVALDIFYIQSWSIWLDLHIFLKTIGVVIHGKGAY
ncbi:MAG TPA: undecaprenyl-phosphate galactose phosphotransferase WbaP [Spirochaetaceae bacterium]|jgi:Undecaprenyl-phosphate galactose phosphotransferase WbaP|nr:undecaprenyl-phosphate galactose phosphotransferase WbaP [Spirochaetaceae bacterium]